MRKREREERERGGEGREGGEIEHCILILGSKYNSSK